MRFEPYMEHHNEYSNVYYIYPLTHILLISFLYKNFDLKSQFQFKKKNVYLYKQVCIRDIFPKNIINVGLSIGTPISLTNNKE